MQNRRRKFIFSSAMALGAAFSGVPILQSATVATPESDVLSIVSSYGLGEETRRTRDSVHYRVKIRCHKEFANTWSGEVSSQIGQVHAEGNTLRFVHKGTRFTLSNVA